MKSNFLKVQRNPQAWCICFLELKRKLFVRKKSRATVLLLPLSCTYLWRIWGLKLGKPPLSLPLLPRQTRSSLVPCSGWCTASGRPLFSRWLTQAGCRPTRHSAAAFWCEWEREKNQMRLLPRQTCRATFAQKPCLRLFVCLFVWAGIIIRRINGPFSKCIFPLSLALQGFTLGTTLD